MKRPAKRTDVPPRRSDNNKRRLSEVVSDELIATLLSSIIYKGSSKHKRNPAIFGLEPFNGKRGDATLCDEHAKMRPEHMANLPSLIKRGILARLVGTNLWTVGDDGWIFEARLTNPDQAEYHGFPVRPSEAIAEPVYRRFREWADVYGEDSDKLAAVNCSALYKFR